MKCGECGSTMKVSRENYKYDFSGLPGITLQGIEIRRCPSCGEEEVVIPRQEGLHHTIARSIITKSNRLTAAEIRFLRKHMGWSGVDFARHMGVTPESVSRWENSKETMNPMADRLLRLMVATLRPAEMYPIDVLANLEETASALRLALHEEVGGWKAETLATT